MAQVVKAHTAPNEALLVFNCGWSSLVHYYAERKGIAAPHGIPPDRLRAMLLAPGKYCENRPIGAVVARDLSCYKVRQGDIKAFLQRLDAGYEARQVGPDTIYLRKRLPAISALSGHGGSRRD